MKHEGLKHHKKVRDLVMTSTGFMPYYAQIWSPTHLNKGMFHIHLAKWNVFNVCIGAKTIHVYDHNIQIHLFSKRLLQLMLNLFVNYVRIHLGIGTNDIPSLNANVFFCTVSGQRIKFHTTSCLLRLEVVLVLRMLHSSDVLLCITWVIPVCRIFFDKGHIP